MLHATACNSPDRACVLRRVRASRLAIATAGVALVAGFAAYARGSNGVRAVVVRDAHGEWESDGFFELVPAIRPPTRTAGPDGVRVWMRLPDGVRFTTQWLRDQARYTVASPAQTVAVRLESIDGVLADVRGTRFEPGGIERFFVLRPGDGGLVGVEWRRGDSAEQRDATSALVALVRRDARGPAGDRAAARIASQNDCANCHAHARPANNIGGEYGLVNGQTDASGLFQIERVLEDHAPLESYGAHDPNVGDPHVVVTCGDAPALVDGEAGAERARCAAGRVPIAHLDIARAIAAGDPHAHRVCDSRRAIFDRLDDEGRKAFAAAFAACGTGVPK